MTDATSVIEELRGIPCVRAVHAMTSRPNPDWPELIVELDETSNAYDLAVVTCALIRALPDVDRRHIGVMWGERMRDIVTRRSNRLELLDRSTGTYEAYRGRARDAVKPSSISVETDERDFLVFQGHKLAPYPDPFRTAAPPPPIITVIGDEALFKLVARLVPRVIIGNKYRIEWEERTNELTRITKKPVRIYIDEASASEVLTWLSKTRPADLQRTFVVCDERGRDWLETFLTSLGVRGVQVLTPDEVPDSLRSH